MQLKPTLLATALSTALFAPAAFAALPSTALPAGATVTGGSASISQANNTMTVSSTGNSVITYSGGFNVGNAATVTFNGGNFLNIDQSGNASEIDGTINGNATGVFVANANGIVVGNGAAINLTGAGGANGGGNFGLAAQDLSGSAQTSAFMSSGTMPANFVNAANGAGITIGTATITAGSAVVNANGNIVNSGSITTSAPGGTGVLTVEAGNQLMNYGRLVNNSPVGGAIQTNYSAQINLIAHGGSGPYSLSLVNQPGGVIQASGNLNLVGHENILNYGTVSANAQTGILTVAAGYYVGSETGSVYDGVQGVFSASGMNFLYAGDLTGGIVPNSANPQPGTQFQNGVILQNDPQNPLVVDLHPLNIGKSRQNVNLVSTTDVISVRPYFTSAFVSTLSNAANAPVDPTFVPSNLFVRSPLLVGLFNQFESGAGNTFYWPGLLYLSNTETGTLATPNPLGGLVTNPNVTGISNVIPNPTAGQGIFFLTPNVYSASVQTPAANFVVQTNAGSNVNTLAGVTYGTTPTSQKSVVSGASSSGLSPSVPVKYTPPKM